MLKNCDESYANDAAVKSITLAREPCAGIHRRDQAFGSGADTQQEIAALLLVQV
jgi:hypothetical protein